MYSLIQDAINQIHPIDENNNNTNTNKRSSKCFLSIQVKGTFGGRDSGECGLFWREKDMR
jgi:hypothetical protein